MPPFRGLPLFTWPGSRSASWRRIRAVSFRLPRVTEPDERDRLRRELLDALADAPSFPPITAPAERSAVL